MSVNDGCKSGCPKNMLGFAADFRETQLSVKPGSFIVPSKTRASWLNRTPATGKDIKEAETLKP